MPGPRLVHDPFPAEGNGFKDIGDLVTQSSPIARLQSGLNGLTSGANSTHLSVASAGRPSSSMERLETLRLDVPSPYGNPAFTRSCINQHAWASSAHASYESLEDSYEAAPATLDRGGSICSQPSSVGKVQGSPSRLRLQWKPLVKPMRDRKDSGKSDSRYSCDNEKKSKQAPKSVRPGLLRSKPLPPRPGSVAMHSDMASSRASEQRPTSSLPRPSTSSRSRKTSGTGKTALETGSAAPAPNVIERLQTKISSTRQAMVVSTDPHPFNPQPSRDVRQHMAPSASPSPGVSNSFLRPVGLTPSKKNREKPLPRIGLSKKAAPFVQSLFSGKAPSVGDSPIWTPAPNLESKPAQCGTKVRQTTCSHSITRSDDQARRDERGSQLPPPFAHSRVYVYD